MFNLDLPYTDGTKAAAVIWGIAWRMTACLLGFATVCGILGLTGCTQTTSGSAAIPSTYASTPSSTTSDELDATPLCTLATVGVSETYFAVADAIGNKLRSMHDHNLRPSRPDADDLDTSVRNATETFLSVEGNQSVKAGTEIHFCVGVEGYITSVDNMDVPAP